MAHYPEITSSLDFKDAAIPRFGHSDVIFDLFLETRFLHLVFLYQNFQNFFSLGVAGPK